MKTASFRTYTGPGRISIARFAPRGTPAGYRIYKPLAPGPWFNSVSKAEYERRYFAQLKEFDARLVWLQLHELVGGMGEEATFREPVLMCYEDPSDVLAGKTYCHRHMVAKWFVDELGIIVAEMAP